MSKPCPKCGGTERDSQYHCVPCYKATPRRTKEAHAAYMRERRQKAKLGDTTTVSRSRWGQNAQGREEADAALEAAIYKRGRQISAMLNTPTCMWPAEWFQPEDDNPTQTATEDVDLSPFQSLLDACEITRDSTGFPSFFVDTD